MRINWDAACNQSFPKPCSSKDKSSIINKNRRARAEHVMEYSWNPTLGGMPEAAEAQNVFRIRVIPVADCAPRMEWRKHGEPESLEIQEGDLRTLPSRLRTLPSREYGAGLACACCPEIGESPSTIRNTVKRACGGAICASVFLLILVQSFNYGRRQSAPTVPPPPAPWSPPPKWPPPPSGPMPCIAGAVVINELDAHGVPQDWVELKNIGAVNCTLQGWYLSDQMNRSTGTHVVSFGADAVVQPGGFYVGYKNHARGDFGFGFGIGDLETVYLRAPDGTLSAMADLNTGHPTGLCFGHVVDTDPGASSGSAERGTPGAENTCYVVPPPISSVSPTPSPPSTRRS